jgi:hypothetical protein
MLKKTLLVLFLVTVLPLCVFAVDFQLIYQGVPLTKPVDLKKLETAIKVSLIKFDWQIVSETEGKIVAKYEKSGGKIMATIQVNYSVEGYSIEYVDSKNLDVNLKKKTIHANYIRWIKNLIKNISMLYLQTAS